MRKQFFTKLVLLGLVGFSGSALASGFQLFEANGAGTGDFYAGGAAAANDASTAYFNPAGLVRMRHPQIILSAVNIFSDVKFGGKDTWTNPTATGGVYQTSGLKLPSSYTQSGNAQGGGYNLVPGFDYAAPINDEFYFGFSEAVPFGLDTNYGNDSFVRYSATQSSLEVVDLSPSIGFKVTDKFSLGVGVDAEHLDAKFNSIAGFPTLAAAEGLNPGAFDTKSSNAASGWGYGWHAGALYQFTPCTRVGLAYRSKVSFTAEGTSNFEGALAGGPGSLASPVGSKFTNNNLTADTTLPATTLLSIYHKFNPAWAGTASVGYTEWNVFDNLTLQNVAAVNAILGPEAITVVVPQGFRNTWRFATGVSYQPFQDWKFSAGVGYDQSPTVSQYRNVRLPDGNRTAIALGTHYQATKSLGLDLGWTHLFFQDGEVNVSQPMGSQVTYTSGKAQTHADLVGVQLTWDFV